MLCTFGPLYETFIESLTESAMLMLLNNANVNGASFVGAIYKCLKQICGMLLMHKFSWVFERSCKRISENFGSRSPSHGCLFRLSVCGQFL